MQSPGRRRPLKRRLASESDTDVLARCAEAATYVGSAEHKTFPSFAGPMQHRSDATKCPTRLTDQAAITAWLREAIVAGQVSEQFNGDFPRYVWALPDDEPHGYEARLTNQEQGTYKGYPLTDEQWSELGI